MRSANTPPLALYSIPIAKFFVAGPARFSSWSAGQFRFRGLAFPAQETKIGEAYP
jgi:hypothetical protein